MCLRRYSVVYNRPVVCLRYTEVFRISGQSGEAVYSRRFFFFERLSWLDRRKPEPLRSTRRVFSCCNCFCMLIYKNGRDQEGAYGMGDCYFCGTSLSISNQAIVPNLVARCRLWEQNYDSIDCKYQEEKGCLRKKLIMPPIPTAVQRNEK